MSLRLFVFFFFFFNDTATTEIYTLSLHDALPISLRRFVNELLGPLLEYAQNRDTPLLETLEALSAARWRSEEHTSELQSPCNLVCRLLLEKKKNKQKSNSRYCIRISDGSIVDTEC